MQARMPAQSQCAALLPPTNARAVLPSSQLVSASFPRLAPLPGRLPGPAWLNPTPHGPSRPPQCPVGSGTEQLSHPWVRQPAPEHLKTIEAQHRGEMYQSLTLSSSPGQAAYVADPGSLLVGSTGPTVLVPPVRVTPVPPYMPTCEPGPRSSQLATLPGWAPTTTTTTLDSSVFSCGSPNTPGGNAFGFQPSTSGSRADGGSYQSSLLACEQHSQPVGAPYPSPYPAYMGTNVAPAWITGPFDGSLLHGVRGCRKAFGEYVLGPPGARACLGFGCLGARA